MALQGITATSTFDGVALLEVLAKTLLNGNAINDGLVTVHTGFHKKLEIPIATMGVKIQDSSCKFTDGEAAGITIAPKYLEPKGFKINEELCFKNLSTTYFKYLQGLGEEANYNSTALMEMFVVEYFAKYSNIFIDASIWNGSANVSLENITVSATATVGGILPGLEADSDVNKVAAPSLTASAISKAAQAVVTVASTADLTEDTYITIKGAVGTGFADLNGNTYKVVTILSGTTFSINVDSTGFGTYTANSASVSFINENNVISILSNLFMTLPEETEDDPNFNILVSKNLYKSYQLAVAKTANGAGQFMVGTRMVDLLGLPLKVAKYFPKNTIVACKSDNLHFGAELLGENENVRVLDMRDRTGDNTYRYISNWGFDVNHTLGSEIVYVRPA